MGCSEEKSEPLPDLPPVEIPATVVGFYSGRLPCDDCNQRAVDMDLFEDGKVLAVQMTLKDREGESFGKCAPLGFQAR